MTTCVYIACTQRSNVMSHESGPFPGLLRHGVGRLAHLAYVNSPFLLHLVEQVLAQIHRFGSQESVNCSNFWLVSILAVWSVWVLYFCTWVAPTEDRLRDKLSEVNWFRKIAGYLQTVLEPAPDCWSVTADCGLRCLQQHRKPCLTLHRRRSPTLHEVFQPLRFG